MAFTPNVPQANQTVASSQLPILNNFTRIDAANDVNHTPLNAANFGRHRNIQMPDFTATVSPGTAVAEFGLYTKIVGLIPRLFYQQENQASALAGFQVSGETPNLTVASGHFFLPGGIEVKFGRAAGLAGASSTVVAYAGTAFASTITAFSTFISGGLVPGAQGLVLDISVLNQVTINLGASAVPKDVGWCVLGLI